jgi:hypothetical protein
VHGGLTAGFGFDTCHASDYNPRPWAMSQWFSGPTDNFWGFQGVRQHSLKTVPWVRLETEFLALQVASQQPDFVWRVSRVQVLWKHRRNHTKWVRFLVGCIDSHFGGGVFSVYQTVHIVAGYLCTRSPV